MTELGVAAVPAAGGKGDVLSRPHRDRPSVIALVADTTMAELGVSVCSAATGEGNTSTGGSHFDLAEDARSAGAGIVGIIGFIASLSDLDISS